ncbi:hypothetical protein SAMN05518863_106153 [Candidatus Pantoea symbiotica]|uniref:Uncharacterized protein n=1 Tax=Candidatus Pantoea symbiotica TaxID=1884370 RepID=A0A1I3YQ76_9GAMM|nr:hypothetical protein SAMN05518863_106153 [Pantoea symbiotica]SFU86583.1 hypothetical protein SAMN05518864_106152 [Pantoea sp. YR525]
MHVVRSVMGQAVINMLDEGIPITNDSLVGYMGAMFEDEPGVAWQSWQCIFLLSASTEPKENPARRPGQ